MAGPPSGLWAERGHPGLVGGRAAERPCPCPCPCPWSEPDPKRGGTQPFHGETVAWRRCSRENQFPLTLLHRETIGGVVMPLQGPTVVRRQLGRRLRRLREAAGKTERDLEEANLVSRAKLWRIESGRTPVKVSRRSGPVLALWCRSGHDRGIGGAGGRHQRTRLARGLRRRTTRLVQPVPRFGGLGYSALYLRSRTGARLTPDSGVCPGSPRSKRF